MDGLPFGFLLVLAVFVVGLEEQVEVHVDVLIGLFLHVLVEMRNHLVCVSSLEISTLIDVLPSPLPFSRHPALSAASQLPWSKLQGIVAAS